MLENIANQLGNSSFKRHLLFLAATVATILFIGYQFGTFDEAMHIPFLKEMAKPALYPGDRMLDLRHIYFSYFWFWFISFENNGWLEPVLFLVHFLTIYFSYWGVWELSSTLFDKPLSSLFCVIAVIVPHFSFVGFPIFEFAVLSRTFVFPFLLFALNQFLKGKVVIAFLVAGLMFNIHVVSVNFILAMFGLACLLEFKRIGIKNILAGLLVFFISALPVLEWKAGGDPIDFSLRPDWVRFLNLTIFSHIFAMIGVNPGTWIIFLSGVSALILFFIAYPFAENKSAAKTARIFVFAGIVVLIVNIITVYWLPVTIIIESQITRVGLWILILAYLFFANYLAKIYEEQTLHVISFWLLTIVFWVSPLAFLPLMAWILVRKVEKPGLLKAGIVVFGAGIAATFAIFISIGFWHPGIFISGENSPWVEVQNWARENTPISARFITPPEKWGVLESDWRVHSERSTAVTFSEVLVAAFEPGYEIEWKSRFNLVAPGAFEKFNGDYFHNMDVTKKAYDNLPVSNLMNAICKMNIQYTVSEKPAFYNFPKVYENSGYIVYDVQKVNCLH